jgi:hypothetical protein
MDILEKLQGEQEYQQNQHGCGLYVLDEAAEEITRLREHILRIGEWTDEGEEIVFFASRFWLFQLGVWWADCPLRKRGK